MRRFYPYVRGEYPSPTPPTSTARNTLQFRLLSLKSQKAYLPTRFLKLKIKFFSIYTKTKIELPSKKLANKLYLLNKILNRLVQVQPNTITFGALTVYLSACLSVSPCLSLVSLFCLCVCLSQPCSLHHWY